MRVILIILFSFLMVSCKKESVDVGDYSFVYKIKQKEFLPIIEGTLNGKKAFFLLDTGASLSIINSVKSKEFGFKIIGQSDTSISGYGGITEGIDELSNITVRMGDFIVVGDFHGKDIDYLVNMIKSHTGITITGIIGNNILSKQKMIIDFENNLLLKK